MRDIAVAVSFAFFALVAIFWEDIITVLKAMNDDSQS